MNATSPWEQLAMISLAELDAPSSAFTCRLGHPSRGRKTKCQHFQQKRLFTSKCVKPLSFTGCFSFPLNNLISLFLQAWMDNSASPLTCTIHHSRKFSLLKTQ